MTWRPLSRVPDVVEIALLDAVRASLTGLDTLSGVRRDENGALAVDLADGRRLHASFRTIAQTPATFGALNRAGGLKRVVDTLLSLPSRRPRL